MMDERNNGGRGLYTGPNVIQPRTPRSISLQKGVIPAKMDGSLDTRPIEPGEPRTYERPDVYDPSKVMVAGQSDNVRSYQPSHSAPFKIGKKK